MDRGQLPPEPMPRGVMRARRSLLVTLHRSLCLGLLWFGLLWTGGEVISTWGRAGAVSG